MLVNSHYSSEGDPVLIVEQGVKSTLNAVGDIHSKLSAKAGLFAEKFLIGVGEITGGVMTADYRLNQKA